MRLRFGERQRWWLREIGVIVVGVLVALGLGEIAQDLRWRNEVAKTRQQIRYEVGHNLALMRVGAERVGCVDRRLDELGAILAEASRTRRLPPLGAIGIAPNAVWPTEVWESQKAGQTAAHFPAAELASISRVYAFVAVARQQDELERDAWTTLNGMVGPGRPLDPYTEGRLYAALAEARAGNVYSKDLPKRVGLLLDRKLGRDFPQVDPKNPPLNFTAGAIPPTCRPLTAAPPPVYGRTE